MSDGLGFTEPHWDAPIDVDTLVRLVPQDATMTGMFLSAVSDLAKQQSRALPSARPRYVSFQRYPLREHCTLLVEAARALYPDRPLRQGLRALGRGAPRALVSSTVGRVVFGSAEGPHEVIGAMAKSYAMHMSPADLRVEAAGERAAIVHLSDVHNFLDCHNVGVFEGVLRYLELTGTVTIRVYSRTAADLKLAW